MSSESLRNTKLRIVQGLSHWLTFEFACKRGYLFSEYYLAQAIGQLLASVGPKVVAEVPHPTLRADGNKGRPPAIDFVVYSGHGPDARPHLAVETKWAGTSDVTAGALAWDAFRLGAHHKQTGALGLLVLAGTKERLKAIHVGKSFKRSNANMPMLPLLNGPAQLSLSNEELSCAAATYVKEKIANAPSNAIPSKIRCERPQYMEGDGRDRVSFGVYVWEISAHAS